MARDTGQIMCDNYERRSNYLYPPDKWTRFVNAYSIPMFHPRIKVNACWYSYSTAHYAISTWTRHAFLMRNIGTLESTFHWKNRRIAIQYTYFGFQTKSTRTSYFCQNNYINSSRLNQKILIRPFPIRNFSPPELLFNSTRPFFSVYLSNFYSYFNEIVFSMYKIRRDKFKRHTVQNIFSYLSIREKTCPRIRGSFDREHFIISNGITTTSHRFDYQYRIVTPTGKEARVNLSEIEYRVTPFAILLRLHHRLRSRTFITVNGIIVLSLG